MGWGWWQAFKGPGLQGAGSRFKHTKLHIQRCRIWVEKTSQEEGTHWKANAPQRSDCGVRAASSVAQAEPSFSLF